MTAQTPHIDEIAALQSRVLELVGRPSRIVPARNDYCVRFQYDIPENKPGYQRFYLEISLDETDAGIEGACLVARGRMSEHHVDRKKRVFDAADLSESLVSAIRQTERMSSPRDRMLLGSTWSRCQCHPLPGDDTP